jgi:hypothetical protein
MRTPLTSLHEIFLVWHPSTSATSDERLRALDSIRARYPETGWRLSLGLLPQPHAIATGTVRPRWHAWAPQEPATLTYSEISRRTLEITDRLLDDAGSDAHRWAELIRVVDDVPEEVRIHALRGVANVDPATTDEALLLELREALRTVVHHHWEFSDVSWSLPESTIEELYAEYLRLEPRDLVARHAWLFAPWPKLPMKASGQLGLDREQKELLKLRVSAMREVLDSGTDTFWRLVDAVESPWSVGYALAMTRRRFVLEVLDIALDSETESHRYVAQGSIAGIAHERGGLDKLQQLLDSPTWTPGQRGEIYLGLPFEPSTWDQLSHEPSGVIAHYWSAVSPYGRGQDLPRATITRAASEYAEWGSPVLALRILALCRVRHEAALMLSIMEQLMRDTPTDPLLWRELGSDLIYGLGSLTIETSELDRVAAIEWYFLPVLSAVQFGYRPRALDVALASDPSFFVAVLGHLYTPEGEERLAPSDEQRALRMRPSSC